MTFKLATEDNSLTDDCLWILHTTCALSCKWHFYVDSFFLLEVQFLTSQLNVSITARCISLSTVYQTHEYLKYIKAHTHCICTCSYSMLCAERPGSNYIIHRKSGKVMILHRRRTNSVSDELRPGACILYADPSTHITMMLLHCAPRAT